MDTLDLLCEPKFKIGLIGSMYFIGLCVAFTFVPLLGDQCGRKWVFILTLVISFFAQLGLLITRNIYETYVYEFFVGASFPGRMMIGLAYTIEFVPKKYREDIIFYFLFSFNIALILLTTWYLLVDRSYFTIQLVLLIISGLTILYWSLLVPESPQWHYTWSQFSLSRKNLRSIASFNGLPE